MKFLGALMIIAAASFCGIKKSRELKQRVKCLDNIIGALGLLKTEISFSQEHIREALIKADRYFDTNGIFTQCAKNSDDGIGISWEKAVEGAYRLSKEDKSVLKRLGARLGITDVTDQKENIIYVTELLKENRRLADEICEKYSRLYSAGGVLIGAAIAVLLI